MPCDRFLIATANPGKYKEIVEILKDLPIEFVFLPDLHLQNHFEEIWDTFEENAIQKARYFCSLSGLPTIADDSGIEVDALKGELHVKTRRFGKGEHATDREWIEYFLKTMEKFPHNRAARFICSSAIVFPSHSPRVDVFRGLSKEHVFFGETKGVITEQLEAPIIEGLPLSSCFRPHGALKVYAALSSQEKAKISHRGKAFFQLKKFLKQLYQ
ncbi:non-canonical purine NTP pyrophosphatase [Candidatus Peregrinibacteria bacterium]|nr:non-canonical purine NTP pyrophosphatase [Candidatus Peregrinibacteria bacterium]